MTLCTFLALWGFVISPIAALFTLALIVGGSGPRSHTGGK